MQSIKQVFGILLTLLLSVALLSCDSYGKKVKSGHVEVYYKEGISKESAEKTAQWLEQVDKTENNNTTETKSIQLLKNGEQIDFRMVANKDRVAKLEADVFYIMGNAISEELFNNKPVNVILTDNKFVTFKTFPYKKMEIPASFGEKITNGNVEVYYADGMDIANTKKLANLLETEMTPSNTISFQFSKGATDSYIVKMVVQQDKIDQVTDALLEEICSKISQRVLTGASIEFQLTDDEFKTLRKYNYNAAATN